MKYLKVYSLFESVNEDLLTEVREAFYNISDRYNVNVDTNKYDFDINRKKQIRVSISSSNINTFNNLMESDKVEIKDIKEDLEFAIGYLTNELNLSLTRINAEDNVYKKELTYNSYNNFINDLPIDSVMILVLYLKGYK